MVQQVDLDKIAEIPLSGEKLPRETSNLDAIAETGSALYKSNRDFIRERIPDNWFVVIEPLSGNLFAWRDQLELYSHVQENLPGRLFYSVGLLKENLMRLYG